MGKKTRWALMAVAAMLAVGVFAASPAGAQALGALQGILPGGSNAVAVAADATDPSDAPQHAKTISDQKSDGTYDLTLDVIGQNIASNEPVDIVLVMDTSGSMEGTRLTNSKNAAKQFVAKFLTDENAKLPADEQVQISLITFGTHVKQNNDFTADDETINRQINNQTASGGTNWQDAFQKANDKNSNRSGVKKYIVFLSDGDPTFRNDAYGANRWDRNDGYSDYYSAWGNGSTDPNGRNYNAAKDAANSRGDATLFVISTASGADTKMNNLAKDTGGAFYKGHDATSLNTALDEVAKFIKQDVGYQDVKITDKLSDYVDFTSLDTSKVTITKTSADGTKVVMPSSQYDLSFNESDRTVTLDLSKTGKLESGATYSMTFNVKPNEAAYQKAVDDGKTGSETASLETNDNDGTTVKYKTVTTFGGQTVVSDEETAHYTVPTIDVPVKTITVNKVWANDTDPSGETESHSAITADIKQGDKTAATAELNDNNKWTASAVVSAYPDYTYSVDETNVPEGYEKTVTQDGATYTITNTHKTWPTTATVDGTKVLNGRTLAEGEFSFEISAVTEGAPLPQSTTVTNAADGSFSFGDITYTETGTYTYKVKETKGELGGVTYDSTEYTVTVTVTEEKAEGTAHGKLVATVAITGADAITFTNAYNASGELSGEQAISGSKQITDESGAWTGGLAGFEFKVELVDQDGNTLDPAQYGVTLPIVNAFSGEDGTFTFDAIKFSKPGNATYYFKVSEVAPATQTPGMTYSTESYIVKVDVTDDGKGTLTAKQAGTTPEGGIVFTNTYTTTPSEPYAPTVVKAVAGKDAEVGQFTFQVEAADDATKSALDDGSIVIEGRTGTEYAQTKQNATAIAKGASETIKFGGITFKKAGTYTFTVTEVQPGTVPTGWTYDTTTYTITVEVKADANAKLVATPTITSVDAQGNERGEQNVCTFSNKFGASTTYGDQGGLNVTKQLDGRTLVADQFTFTIAATEGAENFDLAKAKLVASYAESFGYPITFKNVAPGADGIASMGHMNGVAFDESDINKTFTYTVTEDTTAMSGYTFDENASATVAVTVKEADGKLYTETVVTKGSQVTTYNSKDGKSTAVVPFVNSYFGTTDTEGGTAASIDATKTLTGRDLAEGEFTFNVVNTADKDETVVATATNGADGKLNFTINYDTKTLAEMVTKGTAKETTVDGKRAWVLSYKASEVTPAEGSGITVEKGSFTFSVTVVDNGDGTLTATATLGDGQEATFKNAYGKDAKADATFSATKTLNGRDQKAGEFTFAVTPKADGQSAALAGSAAAADNGAASNVTFTNNGKIEYTIESLQAAVDAGYADVTTVDGKRTWTVHYTVAENTPLPEKVAAQGDVTSYDVDVVVTDNGDGTLSAVAPEATAFTNIYTPDDGKLDGSTYLRVKKTVEGRDWLENETFTFTLSENGEVIDTLTLAKGEGNSTTGSFQDITYNEVGEHTYTITETAGSALGMTYDVATYTVKVEVTYDNTKGEYVVKSTMTGAEGVGIDDNTAAFTNTYEKSTPSKDVASATAPTTSVDGKLIGVGDKIVYTINWANNAIDSKTGEAVAATITITDKVPAGTEFVSAENGGVNSDGTVTWTFDAEAGATGTVSFTAKVADSAVHLDRVSNVATVTVGENDPQTTNEVDNYVPGKTAKDATGSVDNDSVKVGDQITYTLSYKNTEDSAATVTVTDKVPAGTEFVSAENGGKLEGDTVKWTVENVEAGASGTVSFIVKVTEDALTTEGGIQNQASVKIGEDSPEYKTNTTKTTTKTGGLKVSKTVQSNVGSVDNNQDFSFTVTAKDSAGNALTGTYGDYKFNEGTVSFQLKNGQSVEIAGLPEGATFEVTEAAVAGYTTEKTGDTGTIKADATAEAAFTNTYAPGETKVDPAIIAGKVTKVLEGNRTLGLQAGEFSFTLAVAPVEGTEATADGFKTDQTEATNAADGSVSFGNITFTHAGTYQVTIKEVKGTEPNMTYDEHEFSYQIKVSPNGENLKAEVVEGSTSGSVTFTNTYNSDDNTKDVAKASDPKTSVNGQMVGAGDELTYAINWVNNAVDASGKAAAATVTVTDTVPSGVTVKSIADGGTQSGDTITWTIEAAAGASGSVSFTVTVNDDAVKTFDNTGTVKVGDNDYTTNTVTNSKPTKEAKTSTSEGSGLQVGDKVTYTINYKNTNDTAATVTITDKVPEGIAVAVGDISDSGVLSDGTITWTIANVAAGAEGSVSFTGTVAESALSVDAINNTATVKVGEDGPDVKTNTVPVDKPETGSLTISKTVKVESGNPDDNEFTFTLTELKDKAGNDLTGSYTIKLADGTESTIKAGDTFTLKKDQNVTISGLPAGATYKVTEAKVDGYTADKEAVSGTVAKDGTSETFTNTYNTGSSVDVTAGVEVTKNLTGRDWKSTDAFTFTIKADSNTAGIDVSAMPLPAQITATAATDGDHKAVFSKMTFTKEGTYTYKVTENQDALPGGVTAADPDQEATVTITVSDNKKGALTASVTVTNGTFTNIYKPGSVTLKGETAIKGQKTLAGHSLTEAKEFGFTLAPAKDYGEKVVYGEGATAATASVQAKDETKAFAFGDITFNEVGEYSFNVTENGAAETVAGWTLDTHTSTVTVKVTDPDEDGQLKAEVTYGDGDLCKFTNTYTLNPITVTGATDLAGTKSLTGRTMVAGEFTFTIAVGEGSPEGTPLPNPTTATNDANGSFNFGDITFTEPGTYYYDIAEDTNNLPAGVSATTVGSKQVTIVVTDNGKGQLEAKVSQPEGGLAFENEYNPTEKTVKVSTSKKIIAEQEGVTPPALAAGDFSFTIASSDGGKLPDPATVTNDANGGVDFGSITFTKEDLGGEMEKTFNYTITESGTKAGVTNDSAKSFSITVTDDGKGALNATVSDIAGFVNKYTVDPVDYSVTTDVTVTKELTGRDLKADEFEFQLVDASGNVVSEAKNAADGSVTFEAQNYTRPGETTYTIVEKAGELGGVTYDTSSFTVKVTVTDNGDGTLTAKAELQGAESATFKNSYKAAPTSVTLGAAKTLEGKDLQANQFSFELTDSDGKVVQTAKNAADGSIAFTPIEFTEAGQFTYTLTEVNDGASNITYDATKYTVAVVVTDDGTGALKATVTYNNGKSDDFVTTAPVFANTYTAPKIPDNPTFAQTGDSTPMGGVLATLAVAGVALVAAGARTRARKRG